MKSRSRPRRGPRGPIEFAAQDVWHHQLLKERPLTSSPMTATSHFDASSGSDFQEKPMEGTSIAYFSFVSRDLTQLNLGAHQAVGLGASETAALVP